MISRSRRSITAQLLLVKIVLHNVTYTGRALEPFGVRPGCLISGYNAMDSRMEGEY